MPYLLQVRDTPMPPGPPRVDHCSSSSGLGLSGPRSSGAEEIRAMGRRVRGGSFALGEGGPACSCFSSQKAGSVEPRPPRRALQRRSPWPTSRCCCARLSSSARPAACVWPADSSFTRAAEAGLRGVPPSLNISSCMVTRNCCCGPRTLPGLQMRFQPMNALAGKWKCFIAYSPIRVHVRPNPALQWTATGPGSLSEMVRNLEMIS
mmetsp:Transcript_90622/g.293350  ORF Transcript_90622/g.293350 Transcript_90622/m.293350 type:complete len:206 (+) Transcript_90622:51-668(+)